MTTSTSTAEPSTTDTSTSTTLSSQLPSYFVLSDSHARYLDPLIRTERYQLHIRAVSGLQWRDDQDKRYCAHSLIYSNSLSPSLNRFAAVLFLIGINSIRYIDAAKVIQQVAYVINYLQQHYPHLNQKHNISVVTSFPCYKPSPSFPSTSSLSSNIALYNEALQTLSTTLNFTVLDFHIEHFHLANDQLHLHAAHRCLILQSITAYFDNLPHSSSSLPSISKHSTAYKKTSE
jgi:hypothetical protein